MNPRILSQPEVHRRSVAWPRCVAIAVFVVAVLHCGKFAAHAEEQLARANRWTLEEAKAQLHLYPRDAYLQYVVLMLERQTGRGDETSDESMRIGRRAPGRGTSVDLFNLFSGSSAIQESLQLDTMRADPFVMRQRSTITRSQPAIRGRMRSTDERESAPATSVKIAAIKGPSVKSHPWLKMLGTHQPRISALSRYVPADSYFVQFRSLKNLLDLLETSDLWGQHFFSQTWQEARTQRLAAKLKQQLAVETSGVLRPFYDAIVREVAVTGSDLYAREGSDVTLLFRFTQPELFHARMDSFLVKAAKSHDDARRNEGEYQGVHFVEVSTPDRSVHVFSAYPIPELHVRSNSRKGLERVIDAIRGKNGRGEPVIRLGDTPEFAYIRTLMPEGAPEEDGFVYLSDPFIRNVVGPQIKLTECRRMVCYNHLRMIGHAALFHQTQQGKRATSLAELAKANSSPGEFGKGFLACPDGGTYTLAADGLTAVCSHHGHAHSLIPCCEIPLFEVTADEAQQYKAFLENYNEYWRTYFDPIALRIQVRPERYRIETLVLPLIDNTVYSTLAEATGGQPAPLDALPVPNRNIFSVAARLNKLAIARLLGVESLLDLPEEAASPATAAPDTDEAINNLKQIGLAWHNYHDVYMTFPTADLRTNVPTNPKRSGLSWRVHLLPYLDQAALYQQFHLDEPWNSRHNKALLQKIPSIYRAADPKLAAQGKTRYVAPIGDKLLSTPNKQHLGFQDVKDGVSNTIMLVEADDRHAVVWTKPEDLPVDLAKPSAGLYARPPGGFLVMLADGSHHFLRSTIKPATLAALFTRAAGEIIPDLTDNEFPIRRTTSRGGLLLGPHDDLLRSLKIGEFLKKGIGDEIALHVCDADPLFDFSLPGAIGQSLGNFNGPRSRGLLEDNGMLAIALLVSALQSPIYVSVTVQDAKVVDEFLAALDRVLAVVARQSESIGGFFEFDQEFYHLRQAGIPARTYAVRVGPIKWRFFWARIGNGFYIASKPFILQDIAALNSAPARNETHRDSDAAAHAMLRMRPRNWDRVLPNFKLGWAERNRVACQHNVGPLSSLVRASVPPSERKPGAVLPTTVRSLGETTYGTHFYCPEGGNYVFAADGTVSCDLHGTAHSPRQPDAPSPRGGIGKLLESFSGITVSLTFRSEGLRSVVTIERSARRQ